MLILSSKYEHLKIIYLQLLSLANFGAMSQKRCAEEEVTPAQRYFRFKLASPSPENTSGSDTESIHSCQGYETELAKDTSDTSSSPTFNFEYEVADFEGPKSKYYLSDDSDSEEVAIDLDSVFGGGSCDSVDIALFGDTSEENSTSPTSNSDVDPGLPRNDFLDFECCLLCKTDQKDISYPYCNTCFTWKKNLFPSRPKRKQKIVKKDKNISQDLKRDLDSTNLSESSQDDDRTLDNKSSQVLFEDSGVASSELQLSEDVVDGPSQGPSTSSSSSTPSNLASKKLSLGLCRVCFLKPENGVFVHLSIAHLYGCYSCAKKIWFHNGGCPICRRKIFKVARLYV